VTTNILNNHPEGIEHILDVPLGDVLAGAEKTYSIQGNSSHNHTVTLTADQFAMIEAGESVTVTSSSTGHDHMVRVSCSAI
jgi:hypothetical protein